MKALYNPSNELFVLGALLGGWKLILSISKAFPVLARHINTEKSLNALQKITKSL
jgi:hypothetical protein